MDARRDILDRIRRRLGKGPPDSAASLEEQEAYLRAHPRGPLPRVDEALAVRFCVRAEALASTCEQVGVLEDVPAALARYLGAHALPHAGCVWPSLATLDWAGAGIALEARAARGDDALGVTGAFCAIAETGTLMVCSGPDTPANASLLPETHVAVVPAARIVAHMEDGWNLVRTELGELPRAVNFISGPSRTADIEQTVVLGAHGPYRVHIIVVG